MNEAYIEKYSQDRAQYLVNLMTIHDWVTRQNLTDASNLILVDLSAEIVKQLYHMKENLK